MLVMAVREELRRLRDQRDWTQGELASRAGVEVTTVHRVENTKRMPDYQPDFDSIERLVKAFGFTLSRFLLQIEGLPAAQPPSTTVETEPKGGADGGSHVSAALTLRQQMAVACMQAMADTRRESVKAQLNELGFALAGGQDPRTLARAATPTDGD